ncbi:nicotinate-nucleotide adenylyltransferase [Evansella caseinilytica]|uniref:Probable nicotinate-nucleotide adenylyltransferase n=1 Tax=Evansella caseinilytica TaxID=1503961 RepID=A0A1H3KG81_9BACI|nr:nicotinate-nucleotide adenylyltransferase [Evansella caseinilytica]SDY50594.1 nicotinate-nucleotide adenylyltransferase [Evansella caseinilytica]
MKKVGILGGTFDPPHIGHLLMAEEARMQMSLDEIWWMPNYLPPHKEKVSNTSNDDRLAMVNSMVGLHESFRLCDVELRRTGPSYTADTMDVLTKRYKDIQFFFIMGEDSLETLDQWHESERLKSLVSFIVIPRPGYRRPRENVSDGITVIDAPAVDISSSDIREAVAAGNMNRFLLTKEVYHVIKERRLYDDQ